jgi:hypothetical protein
MRCTLPHLAITVIALCLGLGTVLQVGAHEGPTRADGLGDVQFAVSCTDAAQAKFHRAMALNHSFDWPRGKATFAEIASLDPRCGMAQWGLAMVAADNPFGWPISLKLPDGAEAIQQAQDIGAATPRERDYIAALAATYPGDVEAKILRTGDQRQPRPLNLSLYYQRSASYNSALREGILSQCPLQGGILKPPALQAVAD